MTATSTGIVTVFGSVNMDVVLRVHRFPKPGETVIGLNAAPYGGGKGANQAIAAARAGAAVIMIGRVGDDSNGRFMLSHLEADGIDCAQIAVDEVLGTGIAYIAVDDSGENQIIVVHGANEQAIDIAASRKGVLLAQLEVPVQTVAQFFAKRREPSQTILNAAPFNDGGRSLFAAADLIIVNEIELASYCGAAGPSECPHMTADMARSLLSNQQQRIIVTLGKRGSVTVGEDETFCAETPSAQVIDSTGAGDCFCGFLAAQLSVGRDLKDAIHTAHRAAAVAVSRSGASSSIPTMSEVLGD